MQSILGTRAEGQIVHRPEGGAPLEQQQRLQPVPPPYRDELVSATGADEGDVDPDDRASISAGVTAMLVTAGLIGGFVAAGPKGAGAGALLVGGGANLLRAKKLWKSPDADLQREAGTSLTFGLVGIGVGGYLSYLAYEGRNGGDDDDD